MAKNNKSQSDDADMPPLVADISQPFLRIRIWHAGAVAYLSLSEPERESDAFVLPEVLDELARSWLAHRKSNASTGEICP